MRIRLSSNWLSAVHMKKGKLVFVISFFVFLTIYFLYSGGLSEIFYGTKREQVEQIYYKKGSLIDRTKRKQGNNIDFMKVADSQSNVNSSDDLFFSPITAKMARSIQHIRVSGFNFCSILDHSLFNPWVHICILYILNDSRA